MKKFFTILMCLALMLFGLCACAKDELADESSVAEETSIVSEDVTSTSEDATSSEDVVSTSEDVTSEEEVSDPASVEIEETYSNDLTRLINF